MSLLSATSVTAHYGDFQALFGINFAMAAGETVAIIGSNGAGKSTFLRALTGLRPTTGQNIQFDGALIAGLPADAIHKRGLAMVPEGRRLFPSLTVEENLQIGAAGGRAGHWTLDAVYDLFPDLRDKRRNGGTELSGGQQQMVAIGRALMSNPKLLLCDEISLGLSPKVIKDIYAAVPRIQAAGTSLIVVEQDVGQALAVADRIYCFMEGRVSLTGTPATVTRAEISQAYFGLNTEGTAA
ncbi:ABC transporter ATP-binding protein [Actibacterium mucosum KCTC 23349]|uniref:ABC transporter ATP-binding protein n=1 Tax=Actibacterium mucosum KCTC 23349 TaxID=1454373 RepID=A0A037ZGV4_9RHOB|nr:ABC transporter ATP-binding protein [Actibacterium mucosum]KAJ54766.1 ABC transporter ATP-binding protein [Actibacterium mucosum KCTC 23349]